MSPEDWFAQQGPPPEALEPVMAELYQALGFPAPQLVVKLGSPWALRAAVSVVQKVDLGSPMLALWDCLAKLGPHSQRSQPQFRWEKSVPGRQCICRCETVARALLSPPEPGLWDELEASARQRVQELLSGLRLAPVEQSPEHANLFPLGIKVITRGVCSHEPVPFSLNLERLWGALYASDALQPQAWMAPLNELTRTGGWVALFERVALWGEGPQQPLHRQLPESLVSHDNLWPEHWSLQELPHRADGPALTWPDGGALWAWYGLPVARDELSSRQQALRIHRITRERLPASAQPWPDSVPRPWPLAAGFWPALANGVYFLEYPGGQLSLVARARKGQLDSWLLLADGDNTAYDGAGFYYYRNGMMEAFGAYADDDPYPAECSFPVWVEGLLKKMLG